MARSLLETIWLLMRNTDFWVVVLISCGLVLLVPENDQWVAEGIKLIPPSIGILLSGLLTTIAIIFSLMKESDLIYLQSKYGNAFIVSLNRLKYHLLLLLIALLISLLSFIIKPLPLLQSAIDLFFLTRGG